MIDQRVLFHVLDERSRTGRAHRKTPRSAGPGTTPTPHHHSGAPADSDSAVTDHPTAALRRRRGDERSPAARPTTVLNVKSRAPNARRRPVPHLIAASPARCDRGTPLCTQYDNPKPNTDPLSPRTVRFPRVGSTRPPHFTPRPSEARWMRASSPTPYPTSCSQSSAWIETRCNGRSRDAADSRTTRETPPWISRTRDLRHQPRQHRERVGREGIEPSTEGL